MENSEILKKLEELASPAPSDWRKQAEWRQDNRDWLRLSCSVALKVLSDQDMHNANEYVKNTLGCDDGTARLILSGDADLKLSEIVKLIGLDGFLSAAEGLKNYLFIKEKERAAEEENAILEQLKDNNDVVVYCQGNGCQFADECLRKSMYDKHGWFNGICTVVEDYCIARNHSRLKRKTK